MFVQVFYLHINLITEKFKSIIYQQTISKHISQKFDNFINVFKMNNIIVIQNSIFNYLHYININMGISCCCVTQKSSNEDNQPERKRLLNQIAFSNIQICFTKQKSVNLVADCAIIDIGQNFDLSQNVLLKHLSSQQRIEFENEIKLNLQGKQIKTGEIFIHEKVGGVLLKVKYLAFICLPVYKGKTVDEQIKLTYQKLFDELMEKNIQSLLISELQQRLGIPINMICQTILQNIYINKQKLKQVFFVFKNENSQRDYLELSQKYSPQAKRSSVLSSQYE